jgi:hypothetical protein
VVVICIFLEPTCCMRGKYRELEFFTTNPNRLNVTLLRA